MVTRICRHSVIVLTTSEINLRNKKLLFGNSDTDFIFNEIVILELTDLTSVKGQFQLISSC